MLYGAELLASFFDQNVGLRIWKQRMIGDLLVVTSSTAAGLLDLMKRQLASIGCPWMTTPFTGDAIRIFHVTTDAGGDISAARRQIKRQFGEQAPLCALFLDIDCLMHQYSLGTMDVLKGMDKMINLCHNKLAVPQDDRVPYIATVMKVFNIWREHAACSPQLCKTLFVFAFFRSLSKMLSGLQSTFLLCLFSDLRDAFTISCFL